MMAQVGSLNAITKYHQATLRTLDKILETEAGRIKQAAIIVADQVAAATRNDSAPCFGVPLEGVALEGIDLVTNEASHGHGVGSWWVGADQQCAAGADRNASATAELSSDAGTDAEGLR